jgi:hypothetical protein
LTANYTDWHFGLRCFTVQHWQSPTYSNVEEKTMHAEALKKIMDTLSKLSDRELQACYQDSLAMVTEPGNGMSNYQWAVEQEQRHRQ